MIQKKEVTKPNLASKAKARWQAVSSEVTLLTKDDIHLFNEGTHFRLYQKLGAHPLTIDSQKGTYCPSGREGNTYRGS